MTCRVQNVCLNFILHDDICAFTPHRLSLWFGLYTTPMYHSQWLYDSRSCFLDYSNVSWKQITALSFHFIFYKYLQCPTCTQFPTLMFLRCTFMKENLWKIYVKFHNGELSVLSNFLFNYIHQIFIQQRRSSAQPSLLFHWIIQCMLSINITNLTVNFKRFNVPHI